MPHLRFDRDRRGYETTTLVHNARRRGKGQSRILYWFRTPPGIRVGRAAIDEDAIRLLEQHNPDVQFDWTHILKPTPQTVSIEPVRERGFEQDQGRGPRRKERRAFPRAADRPATIGQIAPEPVREEPAPSAPEEVRELDLAATADHPTIMAPEVVLTASDDESLVDDGPAAEDRVSAASQRLGSEGLARLRARYAEVMARIAERPMEDAAREELKLRAERLNPDGWVTVEEVQQALEQYESVYEGVRALVGTRRRRRRRKGGGRTTEDSSRTTEE